MDQNQTVAQNASQNTNENAEKQPGKIAEISFDGENFELKTPQGVDLAVVLDILENMGNVAKQRGANIENGTKKVGETLRVIKEAGGKNIVMDVFIKEAGVPNQFTIYSNLRDNDIVYFMAATAVNGLRNSLQKENGQNAEQQQR